MVFVYHYRHHHNHLNVFAIPTRCNNRLPLFFTSKYDVYKMFASHHLHTNVTLTHIVQIAVTLLQLDIVRYDIPPSMQNYYARNIPRLQISVGSPYHGISPYSCMIREAEQTRNLQKLKPFLTWLICENITVATLRNIYIYIYQRQNN